MDFADVVQAVDTAISIVVLVWVLSRLFGLASDMMNAMVEFHDTLVKRLLDIIEKLEQQ